MHARLLSVLLLASLVSCGYRWGNSDAPWVGHTISVPYVSCDTTGVITRELVRTLAASGSFEYVNCGGAYELVVSVLESNEENIGFRYDVDKDGGPTKTIIPVETRSRILAEFSLVERCSGETVLGPVRVSASAEYDHDFNSAGAAINKVSLGQLTDVEAAQEAVPELVGRMLARRIVDYIKNAW